MTEVRANELLEQFGMSTKPAPIAREVAGLGLTTFLPRRAGDRPTANI